MIDTSDHMLSLSMDTIIHQRQGVSIKARARRRSSLRRLRTMGRMVTMMKGERRKRITISILLKAFQVRNMHPMVMSGLSTHICDSRETLYEEGRLLDYHNASTSKATNSDNSIRPKDTTRSLLCQLRGSERGTSFHSLPTTELMAIIVEYKYIGHRIGTSSRR